MTVFENVELVKFPEFDEVDEGVLRSAFAHFFHKVGDNAKLHLSLKQYKRGGLRAQHEVHGALSYSGVSFFASHKDWLLVEVVQRVLDKLVKEMQKEFHRGSKHGPQERKF